MKMLSRLCVFLLTLAAFNVFGQNKFEYSRDISGITEQWHKITLPDSIFSRLSPKLSDMRILGTTAENDTLEAAYILDEKSENINQYDIKSKIINTSFNQKGHFYTFEITQNEAVNLITPIFKNSNFDWKVLLEGSHDQKEWFTLIKDYRILSIQNDYTSFQFNQINFPDSKYRYYRLHIMSQENPEITSVNITRNEVTGGKYKHYTPEKFSIAENKKVKQSEIEIKLSLPLPINRIKLYIRDTFDYYRPISIKYLTDSVQTEQGWKYNFREIYTGNLHSLSDKTMSFPPVIMQNIKMIIQNNDNNPLTIDSIQCRGSVYEMSVRFTQKADYKMYNGNAKVTSPDYDINKFKDRIPTDITEIIPGAEQKISIGTVTDVVDPLFKNKKWLWAVMIIIILSLGWFTYNMIINQSKHENQ
ncbi:MAG: DUF3999 family protein [Saprospiraceae bacterium]|nr:DUF3999 family protein [Saprospiraceae bacterium]